MTINPGQTVTIDVTITPAGAPGTVVRVTLYIDSFVNGDFQFTGNELAGSRYAYRIK